MASMQVKGAAVSDETAAKQTQDTLSLGICNSTPTVMMLDRLKNWSGEGSFPSTLTLKSWSWFAHGQSDSMAAVQYNGLNEAGVQCAWVLAWHAPARDISPLPKSKLFVVCGPKSEIDAMSFDEIRAKLEVCPSNDVCTNKASKTQADGQIGDQGTSTALLFATFGLV